jgi:hypothetical protein
MIGNIISKCSESGIIGVATSGRDDSTIIGNTLFGNNAASAEGIDVGTGNDRIIILNNLIADWGTGIANVSTALFERYNYFYSNDSDGVTPHSTSVASGGASPWTGDPTAGVFTVSTALKAIGFPGASSQMTTTTGYVDIGAVQRQEAGGASAYAQ